MSELEPAGKFCKKCEQVKPVELFYKNKHEVDGYSFYCKACQTNFQKADEEAVKEKKQSNKKQTVDELVHQVESGTFQVDQKWLLKELLTIYKGNEVRDKLKCLDMIARISGYNEESGDEKALIASLMESMKNNVKQ